MTAFALLLAGCGQRDAVDTPVSWWHQLEGGEIARQRPPPPGVDAPYPRIGTTPAAAPVVASMALRHSVTRQLIEQRALSDRLNAHDPIPPPVAAAPARRPVAAPAPNLSSATLDAAEAAPAARPVPAVPAAPPSDVLSMPAVRADAAGPAGAAPALPPIPPLPPPPPALPGIALPPPPVFRPPPHPDYAAAFATGPAAGDMLQFVAGSDVLEKGQAGILQALAARRGSGPVFVHGFGEAATDAPRDQAGALTLAALRARTVAAVLEGDGVPAEAIRIRADAFGRGARAALVD